MSQASFYRIGAVAMIVGTVLALVFNVVHGRASDATNTEAQLQLGPAGVLLGVAGLLDGLVMSWRGFTFGAFNVGFTVVSILATVWLFAMGVLLWRRAEKLPT